MLATTLHSHTSTSTVYEESLWNVWNVHAGAKKVTQDVFRWNFPSVCFNISYFVMRTCQLSTLEVLYCMHCQLLDVSVTTNCIPMDSTYPNFNCSKLKHWDAFVLLFTKLIYEKSTAYESIDYLVSSMYTYLTLFILSWHGNVTLLGVIMLKYQPEAQYVPVLRCCMCYHIWSMKCDRYQLK
jgi:hypothetical protein